MNKREIPNGYKQINITQARKLWGTGAEITVYPNNVNSYHVFGGWHLGCTADEDRQAESTFDEFHNAWLSYLDSELGRYGVWLIPA